KIKGYTAKGVRVFRGIRYGATTAGRNRFRRPQAVEKWVGVREAVRNACSAPQHQRTENTDPFYAWYSAIETPSEDCLFLNVFTPSAEGKRPVLVWLHGGGWLSYASTAPGFDGSVLARMEDVVVV